MQPLPPWPPPPQHAGDPPVFAPRPSAVPVPARPRWGLASALFVATLLTTTTLGAVWSLYSRLDVMVDPGQIAMVLSPTVARAVWTNPDWLRLGLQYSLPLLFILLCHELGHYLMCRRYRVEATLPHFLPLPLALGTLGAFIRIRSLVPSKRKLFDIAFAGPLAGFVALLPILVYGVAHSPPVAPSAALPGLALLPGHSLTLLGVTRLVHGELPPGTLLNLHPFVLAAWVGLFATALNLLPVGQLDRRRRVLGAVALLILTLALMPIPNREVSVGPPTSPPPSGQLV